MYDVISGDIVAIYYFLFTLNYGIKRDKTKLCIVLFNIRKELWNRDFAFAKSFTRHMQHANQIRVLDRLHPQPTVNRLYIFYKDPSSRLREIKVTQTPDPNRKNHENHPLLNMHHWQKFLHFPRNQILI